MGESVSVVPRGRDEGGGGLEVRARQALAEACLGHAKDRQAALVLVEQIERGLWAGCLHASKSAEAAREAYMVGVGACLGEAS
jgi:hypothetical protein